MADLRPDVGSEFTKPRAIVQGYRPGLVGFGGFVVIGARQRVVGGNLVNALEVADDAVAAAVADASAAQLSELDAISEHLAAVQMRQDAVLYEMQHPKSVLYEGPDVAVAAGGVALTPWIDVRGYRFVGWWTYNSGGAQNLTYSGLRLCSNPSGASPYVSVISGAAIVETPGLCAFSQMYNAALGAAWSPGQFAPLTEHYVSAYAESTLGTTARCRIVGMR
jgi:hypothetical protein